MELDLDGQVAVVTGASKGIGLAITSALVREGVRVIAGARGPSNELSKLVKTGCVDFVQVDLASIDGPSTLVEKTEEYGQIDILVNNVGAVTPRMSGFLEVTDDEWMFSLTLTFMAAVRATRAALPRMLAAGRGAIITTSSVNAFLPEPSAGIVAEFFILMAYLVRYDAVGRALASAAIAILLVGMFTASLIDNWGAESAAHPHK